MSWNHYGSMGTCNAMHTETAYIKATTIQVTTIYIYKLDDDDDDDNDDDDENYLQ